MDIKRAGSQPSGKGSTGLPERSASIRCSGISDWTGRSTGDIRSSASPTTAVTHIAIQEQLDGKMVDWMEYVSDEQYQARSNAK